VLARQSFDPLKVLTESEPMIVSSAIAGTLRHFEPPEAAELGPAKVPDPYLSQPLHTRFLPPARRLEQPSPAALLGTAA
jgi:stage V sporulation protein SpoVS